jgi:peptidoglycan/xylan/chitin deacetylase (PgdA/CDA1 family)
MHSRGIRFGSHTVNHPVLHELRWRDIEAEVRDSKRDLEDQLNTRVTSFAYPYAFPQENNAFARRFAGLLSHQGYDICATTVVGRMRKGADWLRTKRLPINNYDDRALFRAKLEGAYDWLGHLQWLKRKIRRPISLQRAGHID